MPDIKSQKLRIIGVGTAKRLAVLPDVPTISEAGVPGYEATQWYGILAPAATPRDIVMKLNAEMVKALRLPDVRERLAGDGVGAGRQYAGRIWRAHQVRNRALGAGGQGVGRQAGIISGWRLFRAVVN